jgi:hypothetical protein
MPSLRPDQRVDATAGNSILMYEAGAATNAGLWEICVASGVLKIRTLTDAGAAGSDELSVTAPAPGSPSWHSPPPWCRPQPMMRRPLR